MSTLSLSPPEISIEAEHCPEAVIEWYNISGLADRKESMNRKDLALKAKQHLLSLGWIFWYVNKKTKWELRYRSPINGKNYISLRKACESCMEDGGCGSRNDLLILSPNKPSSTTKQTEAKKTSEKRIVSPMRKLSTKPMDDERSKMLRWNGAIEGNEVVSWLVDNKLLIQRTKVFCRGGRRNNMFKDGRISGYGIDCFCCDKFFTLTQFEVHASCISQSPYTSIFLEDGRSLLEIYRNSAETSKK